MCDRAAIHVARFSQNVQPDRRCNDDGSLCDHRDWYDDGHHYGRDRFVGLDPSSALSAVCSAIIVRDFGGGADASGSWVALGFLAGVLICSAAGAFSGVMITGFRLPSFIVTLAMMRIASGLAFRMADGKSIPELPQAFFVLGSGKLMGIPNPVWLMIVLYIIGHIVMSYTVFGRYVYAIGGNEEAARLSGVPVRRMQLAVFTISGALAGLGGIVLASRLAVGDPKFGLMYELDVITAGRCWRHFPDGWQRPNSRHADRSVHHCRYQERNESDEYRFLRSIDHHRHSALAGGNSGLRYVPQSTA